MRGAKQRADNPTPELAREEVEEENVNEENGFFACYLLCSLCPRYKGHTYIGGLDDGEPEKKRRGITPRASHPEEKGKEDLFTRRREFEIKFTINPRRRIRQHNGEIRCGAWRTKCKRPWEMILCIYGFPSNVSALQFEWAWQHPKESLAVRKAAASFRSLSGIENKIKLAYTMLTLPQWERLNLTVNFFSTKYQRHSAQCPKLPKHMKMSVHAMDELPCYMVGNVVDDEDDDGEGSDKNDGSGSSDKDNDHTWPPYVDISMSTGTTSVDGPFESGRQSRELCDLLHEGESNCYSLQREPMVSPCYTKPLKPMGEMNRTTTRIQSAAMSDCDDLFRQEEDNLRQVSDPLDPCHLIVSPLHGNKAKPTTPSGNTLFPCNRDLFGSVKISNLTQWKQLSTARTAKYGISCGTMPLSPECNVIDLSTPSTCKARSVKRRTPPTCVEIIDLIDSPI